MNPLPIRLTPGQDLRAALEAAVLAQNCRAAFVLSGIGSLSTAGIRLAGAAQPTRLTESMEILTLSGTVAVGDGGKTASHMHMAISTATGQVLGGHVAPCSPPPRCCWPCCPTGSSSASRMRQRATTSWWCGHKAELLWC
jgi:uncharacterized protein